MAAKGHVRKGSSLLVFDLRDRAQLFRCRCPETEELQVRGNLLEQHIGADLDRTTLFLRCAQEGSHFLLHHDLTHERSRSDPLDVKWKWIAVLHPERRRIDYDVVP